MSEVAIRELVLDGGAEEGQPRHAATRRSAPTFEVVANSGADFAVRRRCGRSSRLWVMLVSQAQYYVKDESTGEVRRLDDKALASFLAGCGTLHVGCQWLDCAKGGKEWRGLLMEALGSPCFERAATSGLWRLGDGNNPHLHGIRAQANRERTMRLVAEHLPLAKSVGRTAAAAGTRESRVRGSFPALVAVELAYGLDCARRLLDSYVESGVGAELPADETLALLSVRRTATGSVRRMYHGPSLLALEPADMRMPEPGERLELEFGRFSDYLLSQSVREGMAGNPGEWLSTWRDTLLPQLALYGRAVDKYPDNLLTTHQRLVYASRDVRAKVEEAVLKEATARLASLDRAVEGEPYLVTHPTCAQDMKDEAAMQHNCLVGYIGSVMRGDAIVMFCRRADAPDRSHVTLEVAPATMRLVQAKARSNREPDDETMRFLSKWCAEAGVHPGRYAERMRGLGR